MDSGSVDHRRLVFTGSRPHISFLDTENILMTDHPFVQAVTAQTFEAYVLRQSQDVLVLVDFWADWCNPCKMLMPILDQLASEYDGKFLVAKVDTDQERELAATYGIRSLPTVKVFRRGQVVDEFMGALPESSVREIVERHLDRPADQIITKAQDCLDAGNPADAVALLSEALDTDPTYLKLRLSLAQAQIVAGYAQQALDTLSELPANEAMQADVKQIRARAEIAAGGQSEMSAEELMARVEKDPNDLAARLQWGKMLLSEPDKVEDALAVLIEIVRAARNQNEGEQARQCVIQVFESLGSGDPRVGPYRRQLAQALN